MSSHSLRPLVRALLAVVQRAVVSATSRHIQHKYLYNIYIYIYLSIYLFNNIHVIMCIYVQYIIQHISIYHLVFFCLPALIIAHHV